MRELAASAGFGQPYFKLYWSRRTQILENARAVQDETKSIFIHIPKAAGMSVWKSLYGVEEMHGHPPACAYQSQESARFKEYFTFSLVRNPIDRFVSAFYFLKSGGLTEWDKKWAKHVLAAWDTPDALAEAMSSPLVKGRILSWKHFTPQSWYLTDWSGQVAVDYVGTVEDFDESMAFVAARLGQPFESTQTNQSVRPSGVQISEKARRTLVRIYSQDFALIDECAAGSSDGQKY